jgi:hypothetical protein
MKMFLALLALVISTLSLALQLRGQKPVQPLEKFMVPAQLNDLGQRLERADVRMIRDSIAMSQGVGVPFIREITADHQHLIVRVFVSEQELPRLFDQRQQLLITTALLAQTDIASELDLEYSSAAKLVIVQFVSIQAGKGKLDKTYAEFRGGELTFH